MTVSVKESIFFLLPQGKPDPKIARPEIGEDTRRRVVQKSPQGPICWYYALKILREQYGAKAPSCFLKQRVLEKLISTYRKMLSGARHDAILEAKLVNEYETTTSLSQVAHTGSPEAVLLESKLSYPQKSGIDKLAVFISDFSKQSECSSLRQFAQWRKLNRVIDIHTQMIKILKVDPEVEFEKERKLRPWHTVELRSLPVAFRATFLSTLAIRIIARDVYQMRESSWTPHQPVIELIHQLRVEGPMFINGLFGRMFYRAECQPMEQKLHGKTIWYWPIGSAIEADGSIPTHSIVVIGADQEGSRDGRVFFVDPGDGSDPSDPEMQRVYVMSYRRLVEKVFDLFGEKFDAKCHTPLIPYALHGPLHFTPAEVEGPSR